MSSVRRFYFPECGSFVLTDVLYALSDPTRLRIVAPLAGGSELSCNTMNWPAVPKSTLSHHLKVLRESGIITTRAEGTLLFNALRRADLDQQFPGLLDAVLSSLPHCPQMGPLCSHPPKADFDKKASAKWPGLF